MLCQFEKFELIKGREVFKFPSWDVRHFLSLKSRKNHPNEFEQKRLAQNKNNIMLSIFGNFDLMLWWKANAISGSTTYPFEEEIDHSKIPQVLSGKLDQLNINFENNIPGTTKKMKNDSN